MSNIAHHQRPNKSKQTAVHVWKFILFIGHSIYLEGREVVHEPGDLYLEGKQVVHEPGNMIFNKVFVLSA